MVLSPVEGKTARLTSQIDYGRLRIKTGQDAMTETFALGYFADARLGLEAYADAVASVYSIKLPRQPAGYCTWYPEKHGGACDEKYLAQLWEYAAKNLKQFGFDFVQIDDQWQAEVSKNGPKRDFTTHNPIGPYPAGMKAAADGIKSRGLIPEIWFMPFAGTYYDPVYKDHQDWFVKDKDGKPFETAWGGTFLDMTQAGARQHLRGVVQRIADDWGYTIFRMDGLWTGTATKQINVNDGYRDDQIGEAVLSDPDRTNLQANRDGLKRCAKWPARACICWAAACRKICGRWAARLGWSMRCASGRTPVRAILALRTGRGCGSCITASGRMTPTASQSALTSRWIGRASTHGEQRFPGSFSTTVTGCRTWLPNGWIFSNGRCCRTA